MRRALEYARDLRTPGDRARRGPDALGRRRDERGRGLDPRSGSAASPAAAERSWSRATSSSGRADRRRATTSRTSSARDSVRAGARGQARAACRSPARSRRTTSRSPTRPARLRHPRQDEPAAARARTTARRSRGARRRHHRRDRHRPRAALAASRRSVEFDAGRLRHRRARDRAAARARPGARGASSRRSAAVRRLSSRPGGDLRPAGRAPGDGAPADVTVIDPAAEWTRRGGRLQSKSRNSPFLGLEDARAGGLHDRRRPRRLRRGRASELASRSRRSSRSQDGTVFRGALLRRRAARPPARSSSTRRSPATRRSSPTRRTAGQIVTHDRPGDRQRRRQPRGRRESRRPCVAGFVVRECRRCRELARARDRCVDYLGGHGVAGISGIDTRAWSRAAPHGRRAARRASPPRDLDDASAGARARRSTRAGGARPRPRGHLRRALRLGPGRWRLERALRDRRARAERFTSSPTTSASSATSCAACGRRAAA